MQDDAIILTESTFSFGALADMLAPVALLSTVPVTSILWPTCGVSFASSPSRRYDDAVEAVAAAPLVPVALAEAPVTFVWTNFGYSVVGDALAPAPSGPAVPLLPAAALASLARSRQPLTVTLASLEAL